MKSANFFVRTAVSSLTVQEVRLVRKLCSSSNFIRFYGFYVAVFSVVMLSLPLISNAQVMFSEIAWMGTDTDANDEWIELYNFSGTPTDVTGWTITQNGTPFISLTGTIPPYGVVVLERTDDAVLPQTAFQIYTGALSNSGATLQLLDGVSVVSDEVVSGANWSDVGGSNTVPKMTPQRTRTGTWVTGAPTPGADNVQESTPVTEDEEEDSNTTSETASQTTHTSSGGGSSRKTPSEKAPIFPGVLSGRISAPKIAYVNQEINLEVIAEGLGKTLINSLVYTWNFGDTYLGGGKKTVHTFAYPGEYIVAVEAIYAKHTVVARHEITVLPQSFELSRTGTGDVVIRNASKYEVDMGGYVLTGNTQFTFPKMSFIKANGTLTIPHERIGGSAYVVLRDTARATIAVLGSPTIKSNTVVQVARVPQQPEIIPEIVTEVSQISEMSPVQETVIRIGESPKDSPENGVLARLVHTITRIFNR